MKNYEKMSDYEVNAAVSIHVLWKNHRCEEVDCNDKTGVVSWADGANWHEFNPCNNPSDAWPIIIENSITFNYDTAQVHVSSYFNESIKNSTNRKYALRAAMIVFLMMQEQKS